MLLKCFQLFFKKNPIFNFRLLCEARAQLGDKSQLRRVLRKKNYTPDTQRRWGKKKRKHQQTNKSNR